MSYRIDPKTGEYTTPEGWRKVGKILREAREKKGISLKEAARRMAMTSASTITYYERSGVIPPPRLRLYAGILGLDYNELAKIHGVWPDGTPSVIRSGRRAEDKGRGRSKGRDRGRDRRLQARTSVTTKKAETGNGVTGNGALSFGMRLDMIREAIGGLSEKDTDDLLGVVDLLRK